MIRAAAFLLMAGSAMAQGWPADGEYRLLSMDDRPVTAPVILRIMGAEAIGGYAGCNSFSARLAGPPPAMTLGPIRITRRMCAEIETERRFLERLRKIRDLRVDGGGLIALAEGQALMRFQRVTD